MQAGAHGVAIGRNMFQDESPRRLLRAICRLVHRGFSAADAWEEAGFEGDRVSQGLK
jgi:hypothetical protein